MGKTQTWLLSHLPAGLIVHPAEWFLAMLCFLSGITIVTGVSRPGSVAKLLWHPIYEGWGISLLVGSIALIAGLSSIRWARGTDLYTIKRVPIYKLGLRLLGLTSSAYAVAVLIAGRWNGTFSAAVTLAFAAMCAIRLLNLGRNR
jgi:hypothetical protein